MLNSVSEAHVVSNRFQDFLSDENFAFVLVLDLTGFGIPKVLL